MTFVTLFNDARYTGQLNFTSALGDGVSGFTAGFFSGTSSPVFHMAGFQLAVGRNGNLAAKKRIDLDATLSDPSNVRLFAENKQGQFFTIDDNNNPDENGQSSLVGQLYDANGVKFGPAIGFEHKAFIASSLGSGKDLLHDALMLTARLEDGAVVRDLFAVDFDKTAVTLETLTTFGNVPGADYYVFDDGSFYAGARTGSGFDLTRLHGLSSDVDDPVFQDLSGDVAASADRFHAIGNRILTLATDDSQQKGTMALFGPENGSQPIARRTLFNDPDARSFFQNSSAVTEIDGVGFAIVHSDRKRSGPDSVIVDVFDLDGDHLRRQVLGPAFADGPDPAETFMDHPSIASITKEDRIDIVVSGWVVDRNTSLGDLRATAISFAPALDLEGTVLDDRLRGLAQGDRLDGGAGGDSLEGGGGNDTLIGGDGDDTIDGQAGNDRIFGGAGFDTITDTFSKARGGGTDVIFAGDDTDIIAMLKTTVEARGEGGDDIMTGGGGDDVMEGGADDDEIDGGGGNDTLIGGTGNDTINGGAGKDRINAGDGDDMITDTLSETGGGGKDLVFAGAGDDTIGIAFGPVEAYGEAGEDRFTGFGLNDFFDGGKDDDVLKGGAGNDTLVGGEGSDELLGEAGNDRLIAGFGTDFLTGGAGRDRFVIGRTVATEVNILDFDAALEKLDYTAFKGFSFSDLTIRDTASGCEVRVDGTSSPVVLLDDVSAASLSAQHFLF